ncbi:fungal-specific transcription factor domain-containing protein [Tricladium varicosporioides]|nr:fungal-specific transcription factor domain-containing protein [Hymenoscyphus varicosporioides]
MAFHFTADDSLEIRPSCQKCEYRGQKCVYGYELTWLQGNTPQDSQQEWSARQKRKVSHNSRSHSELSEGFHFVNSPGCKRIKVSGYFLNTTFEDFEDHPLSATQTREATKPNLKQEGRNPKQAEMEFFLVPVLSDFHSCDISMTDKLLLDFYANRMCQSCTLLDGHNNNYRSIVIPLSLHSPLLLRSVLAVAANHVKARNPNLGPIALQYQGSTLKSLSKALSDVTCSISKTEMLGTILMLCLFDISRGTAKSWMRHLEGARRILELPSFKQGSSFQDAVSSFLGQYFASRSIIEFTTSGDLMDKGFLLDGARYWLNKIARPKEEINCFTGCSNELLEIVVEICERVRAHKQTFWRRDCQAQKKWKANIEERLNSLSQSLATYPMTDPRSSPPQSMPRVSSAASVGNSAEAFRQGAILLLHQIEPYIPSDDLLVRSCTRNILDLMHTTPPPLFAARANFFWPYIMAAYYAKLDEDRVLIMSRLSEMAKYEGFEDINSTQLKIETFWKRQDLDVAGKVMTIGASLNSKSYKLKPISDMKEEIGLSGLS